jgi:hypothetical protein
MTGPEDWPTSQRDVELENWRKEQDAENKGERKSQNRRPANQKVTRAVFYYWKKSIQPKSETPRGFKRGL